MIKISLILIFGVSLSVVISENQSNTSATELDVPDLTEIDGDTKSISKSQRRKDLGYSYPRPDRGGGFERSASHRTRLLGRYATGKPFNRYGPPKQVALHRVKPNYQNRPLIQHQNTFSTTSSPIASQNEEPFKHNANYLPPRNQKLPTYSVSSGFRPHLNQLSFNPQRQNFIPNNPQSVQISDAAQFLSQNSQAISQLYDSPATNIDYEPLPDSQSLANQEQSRNGQTLNITGNALQRLQNSQGFSGPLPSYSSGILESHPSLEPSQAEKNRVTTQHRSNALQDPQFSRYAQYHDNYLESLKFTSSSSPKLPLDTPVYFNIPERIVENPGLGQSSILGENSGTSPTLSYGAFTGVSNTQVPSVMTSISTSGNGFSGHHQPQGITGIGSPLVGTLLPTTGGAAPQFDGFRPTLIAGANFLTGVPNYGTTFVTTSSSHSPGLTAGSSPTYFNIPIPTTSGNKPQSSAESSSSPALPKPGFPVVVNPQPLPAHHFHLQPVTPVQPIFPIVPSALPAHPAYGIQPAPANSVVLKPVKPVYPTHPVYYYPVIHKPSGWTPLNSKPGQSWK